MTSNVSGDQSGPVQTPVYCRPWFLNATMLVALGAAILFLPDRIFGLELQVLISGIQFAAAIWAYRDARELEVWRRTHSWGGLFGRPWRVFWLTFLVWPLFFPLYVSYRHLLRSGKIALRDDDILPLADREAEDTGTSNDAVHYVILVHGTWAAPKGDEPRWYSTNSPATFASILHSRLADGPLGAAVERGSKLEFAWSGLNRHDARVEAGNRLCDLLLRISKDEPRARIHIVAHSHGGNVVLHALHSFIEVHATRGAIPTTLGRIVFMGTPFYCKYWLGRGAYRSLLALPFDLIGASIASVLSLVLALQYALLLAGVAMIVWRWHVTNILDLRSFYDVFLFWNWHPVIMIAAGYIVLRTIFFVSYTLLKARPIDSNVYFDLNRLACGENQAASLATFGLWRPSLTPTVSPEAFIQAYMKSPRLSALVLTSNYFDEPLMALSAAPMIGTLIEDSVRSALRPRWPTFPHFSIDDGGGHLFSDLAAHIGRLLLWLLATILVAVAMPILWPTYSAYTRASSQVLIQKAKALGFGLPSALFGRWDVISTAHIGVPFFFNEEFTDISKDRHFPLVAPKASTKSRSPTQYGYLWNDELLRQRASRLSILSAHRAEDVKRAATIEDRIKELAQSVDLTHSAYYQDDEDIERIAHFLEQDKSQPTQNCLTELGEMPNFGQHFAPAGPVIVLTLLFAGLKLWGVSWIAEWPWLLILAPYLVAKSVTELWSLRIAEKKANYIRGYISSTRTDDTSSTQATSSRDASAVFPET